MCNRDLVKLEALTGKKEQALVKELLRKHVVYTGSPLGDVLLKNWAATMKRIIRVIPKEYEEMLAIIEKAKVQKHTQAEAEMIAFNSKYAH